MSLAPIADARIRQSVRLLYMGSGLIFLATVGLGITQVFMDEISHAQILAHFHAGTIGWVTLSVIATALWAFTGDRPVSQSLGSWSLLLAGIGVIAVAGYVFAFGTAFSSNGPFWLLPAFGIPAGLVILGGFLVTATQMRRLPVVTTPHLLLFGALLVATLGATMGIIWGLTYSTGIDPYGADGDGVGAHAGPMDMYLALAFAAFVEILIVRGAAPRWRWPGMTQMVLGVVSGFVASTAIFIGIEPLIPVALLMFLVAFIFYFARVGWRTFTVNPASGGTAPGLFFGGIGLPIYIGLFVTLVTGYFVPGKAVPHVLEVIFGHTTFVLMATNLVLCMQARHTDAGGERGLLFWGLWALNVGVLAFFATETLADERKDGALLMAAGVLVALHAVWMRLARRLQPAPVAPAAPVSEEE